MKPPRKIKYERQRQLHKLMEVYRLNQITISRETKEDKGNVNKYYHGVSDLSDSFWDRLQERYEKEFAAIAKLDEDEAEKDRKKVEKEEKKQWEGSEYISNVVREEMKERWAEQDRVNSELRVEVLKLRTEFETFKEQLNAPDAPSGKADIPSSDFLKDQDLLDEDPIDKKDLPKKKSKRKPKSE